MLLAAGASVEAMNKFCRGPRDGTDATGREGWEGGAIGESREMRHDIEFAASFAASFANFVPGIFSVLYVIAC